MLDLVPDAFAALDVKFLEPACGSGNFLAEILRRKLRLVAKQTARPRSSTSTGSCARSLHLRRRHLPGERR